MNEPQLGTSSFSYGQYCSYRLPCGICTRTNLYCPMAAGTVVPTWIYKVTCSPTGTAPAEEVYAKGADTAGNYHWTGTQTGEHTIPENPLPPGYAKCDRYIPIAKKEGDME